MFNTFVLLELIFVTTLGHIVHWKAEPRSSTLVAFGLPDYDQEFAKFAIEANLSVAMILLPITGDIEADFTALCGMLNKTTRPIGLIDASWPEVEKYRRWKKNVNKEGMTSQQQAYNTDSNRISDRGNLKESVDANAAVRCYRRQLLVSLSARLQLPLVVLTEMRECPGTMIDAAVDWSTSVGKKEGAEYPFHRLTTPNTPALVSSISPSRELLAELLKHLTVLNEEAWKGFAIVYENEEDFVKYRSSLESIQTSAIIRCWEKNSFFKAQIIREIKHLHAYFLDLSNQNTEQFFQMGPLEALINSLRNVKGKLVVIRYKLPGIGKALSKQSLHQQMSQNVISYYAEAVRLAGPNLQVPNHICCEPVKSALLRTADGLLVSHKEGPHINYNHGHVLHNNLKQVLQSSVGYTEGEASGRLLDYGVEMISVRGDTINKYADWNMKQGFVYTKESDELWASFRSQFENKTFIVTTIEDPPFVIYEPFRKGKHMEGKDQWTGFAMELLKHLSKMNHFDYVIKPVEDRKFGTFDETKGRWDGLIGELIYKKAHLAVASLTITYDRERVIDFTTPFMSLSLSVIIQKSKQDTGLQFTAPLSREVWISVLIAYIVVSLMLFLLGRVTPHEWYARHPCSTRVENQFTLCNSFWFTVGSLMQQGCDISPRATSTRIIGTIWWFFILIMVSSYTANLAAFLTIDRMETEIENVEDLTRQTKIKYGTLYGGSTYSFFKHSDIPTYQRMWEFMNANKSLFVNKTEEGIVRALNGDYAFILESTLNEYYSQRNCQLTPLGGLLDPRGYGIGLPIGNNGLRDLLSEGILKLQKDQTLEKMRQYWLQRYNATVPCYLQSSQSALPSRTQLTMAKMSSAFIGLGAGLLLGLIVWVGEMINWLQKLRHSPNRRSCTEVCTHLRHVLCESCNRGRRRSLDEALILPYKRQESEQTVPNGVIGIGQQISSSNKNNAAATAARPPKVTAL
ncbi:Glutamate receptor ionotropic, kainate 3 [Clonorchis sinensis]|uniref:Glutamate receptor ionotropic, kainate 3 n=1 Tax=Clonorchis sinensis TaxID=79923 RepID=A0A8T1MD13_CLOSI|nr:Glutamate receptor ionotropic, kainate 3 [Clonorchis sinensis]